MVEAIIFYMLAAVVLVSGTAVILSRNPVHSVLWLILAFFNSAGLFLLLGAEFLAMLLVIVYVGAVAVLFLFVVMMLDIDFASLRAGFVSYLPFGLILAGLLAGELIVAAGAAAVIGPPAGAPPTPVLTSMAGISNTEAIGALLYTRYVYVFQGAGMILLTAMIGAIVLTHRSRGGVKRQNIARQVARQPGEAVRITKPKVGEGVEL
ncbi:NADH:ubiquinone oxidoreductase subunit J [Pacificimonas flava]|uniref:NADH-quinone oxidoreductase subunit J n=2 Tax=Pacificimonas TaxID=1960290 RepID=A0A219B7C3_9SPHN|nr:MULTISPECIES: NADH-quinone oxidoreductase subunit J [Pacificimonas]MBZ6378726.1 NADH-quinone oxidoreductase subunit J [Pacificimonas aurantium]OWV34006.1 NADH:ubiquinone oxidoreductase subunit J [Pacificimonas flava]